MKAVMYHYVRVPSPGGLKLNSLHFDDFRRQLDYFAERFTFPTLDRFLGQIGSASAGRDDLILTFDDGFRDHFDFVFPELVRRKLWGIFYIPVAPLRDGVILDVHRIHILLGSVDHQVLLSDLLALLSDGMITDSLREEFTKFTYRMQVNSETTTKIKRLLNYFLGYEFRTAIIDRLFVRHVAPEAWLPANYYLKRGQLAQMENAGMLIGNHSVNHKVLSRIGIDEQKAEIGGAFAYLDSILPQRRRVRTFCYPHGGFHTFTDATEALLRDENCVFAFNVESRDIDDRDLAERPMALPRYNCNEFPHGQVRQ